jgi:hypothetical protein
MFQFKHAVRANDLTIKKLIAAANHFGVEEVNWTFGWLDGGRVVFAFDTKERLDAFRTLVWIHGISN